LNFPALVGLAAYRKEKRDTMHAHPLEARIAHVEGAFGQVNERLGSIERRLDTIDGRFNHVDARFDHMEARFNWVIGTLIGSWATTILAVLFHR
jgi:tetrahydromethanopterin S-methyltransferase subunit G